MLLNFLLYTYLLSGGIFNYLSLKMLTEVKILVFSTCITNPWFSINFCERSLLQYFFLFYSLTFSLLIFSWIEVHCRLNWSIEFLCLIYFLLFRVWATLSVRVPVPPTCLWPWLMSTSVINTVSQFRPFSVRYIINHTIIVNRSY